MSTIAEAEGLESGKVTSELIVLWVLTFVLDFFVVQPLFVCLRWSGRSFDASWSLSGEVGDVAQHLYSL